MIADHPERFPNLELSTPVAGVLEITLGRPGADDSLTRSLHYDLTHVWTAIDQDPDTLVVILRGRDGSFSSGGDYDTVARLIDDRYEQVRIMRAVLTQVYNFINCQKPVISAIQGRASGGGLPLALLADISIAGRSTQLIDPHARLGVPAGDHSAMIWPILCGLAKAKYHLFTCEPISGEEAERIGLVSLVVDDDQVIDRAREVAAVLTQRSQFSLQWTKYAMNNWLRLAGPSYDFSLALEMLGFAGPEAAETVEALRSDRRPPFNGREMLEALAGNRPSR